MEVAVVVVLVWLPWVFAIVVDPELLLLIQVLFVGVWLPPVVLNWVHFPNHRHSNLLLLLTLTPL